MGFKLDCGQVLDATPEYGVSIREAQDDESTQYWKILAPTRSIDAALMWGYGQVGKPYDWRGIISFGLRRDWHDDKRWFCSEFVAAAFDYVHWPLLRDAGRSNRITPRDLLMSPRIQPVPRSDA